MKTSFYSSLKGEVSKLGGYHNAHLHLDRAYTLDRGTPAASSRSQHSDTSVATL